MSIFSSHRRYGRTFAPTCSPFVCLIFAASAAAVLGAPAEARAAGDADDARGAVGGGAPATAARSKKDPPLKVSAWCPFRDRGSTSGAPKSDPGSVELRKGAGAWISYCRAGRWMPLVVEMRNTTEDSVLSGTIRIRMDPVSNSGSESYYRTHYVQPYEIPPKSPPMRYRFSLWIPSGTWGRQYFVTVEQRGGFASATEVPFNMRDLDAFREDLIVVLSEKPGAFGWLGSSGRKAKTESEAAEETGNEEQKPGEGDGEARSRRIVCWCGAEEFPSRWYELAAADLIIVDGPPREALSGEQMEALAGYVMAGGRAVLNCGKDISRLRGSSLAKLFGLEVKGLAAVPSLTPLGPPGLAGEDLPAISLAPAFKDMAVLRQEKTGVPLMLRRAMGLGELTTFAFDLDDPSLAGWAGRAPLAISTYSGALPRSVRFGTPAADYAISYSKGDYNISFGTPTSLRLASGLMTPAPQGDSYPGGGAACLRTALNESFAADSPVSIPSRDAVAGVLLIYLLLLVPVNYLVSESFNRRELSWIAVPILSAVFALAAYKAGFAGMTARVSLSGVSLVELAPGADKGVGWTFMGLYSPSYRAYGIKFPGLDAAPNHLLAAVEDRLLAGAEGRDLYLRQGGREMEIAEFAIPARSARGIEAIHLAELRGPIKVSVETDGAGFPAAVEVSNGSGFALLAPSLIWSGKAARVAGEIPAGAGGKFFLRPSDFGGIGEVFARRDPAFPDASRFYHKRSEALRAFLAPRMEAWGGQVFLAWVLGAAPPVAVDGRDAPIGGWLSLIAMPLDVGVAGSAGAAEGGAVPAGFWVMSVNEGRSRNISGQTGGAGGAAAAFYYGAERVEALLVGPRGLDIFAAYAKGSVSVEMGLDRYHSAVLKAAGVAPDSKPSAKMKGTAKVTGAVELEIRRLDGSWHSLGKSAFSEDVAAGDPAGDGDGNRAPGPRIRPMQPVVFNLPEETRSCLEGGRSLRFRLTVSDIKVGGKKAVAEEHAYPVLLLRIAPAIEIQSSKQP